MSFCRKILPLDQQMHTKSDHYSSAYINRKISKGRKFGYFPLSEDFVVLYKYVTTAVFPQQGVAPSKAVPQV